MASPQRKAPPNLAADTASKERPAPRSRRASAKVAELTELAELLSKAIAERNAGARGDSYYFTPVGAVVMTRSGAWWAANLPSFPGAHGQGKTPRAAFKNLMQAVRELAASYADDAADFVP